jgi:hypothetical protein
MGIQSPILAIWQIQHLIFRSPGITAMPAVLSLRYFNAFSVPPHLRGRFCLAILTILAIPAILAILGVGW